MTTRHAAPPGSAEIHLAGDTVAPLGGRRAGGVQRRAPPTPRRAASATPLAALARVGQAIALAVDELLQALFEAVLP